MVIVARLMANYFGVKDRFGVNNGFVVDDHFDVDSGFGGTEKEGLVA